MVAAELGVLQASTAPTVQQLAWAAPQAPLLAAELAALQADTALTAPLVRVAEAAVVMAAGLATNLELELAVLPADMASLVVVKEEAAGISQRWTTFAAGLVS